MVWIMNMERKLLQLETKCIQFNMSGWDESYLSQGQKCIQLDLSGWDFQGPHKLLPRSFVGQKCPGGGCAVDPKCGPFKFTVCSQSALGDRIAKIILN